MEGYVALAVLVLAVFVVLFYVFLWGKFCQSGIILSQAGQTERRWRECGTCEGTGAEWLSNGVWQPIPEKFRSWSKTEVRAKIANTRTCMGGCHGLGGMWVQRVAGDVSRASERPVPVIHEKTLLDDLLGK
jgi:hypothetical protein